MADGIVIGKVVYEVGEIGLAALRKDLDALAKKSIKPKIDTSGLQKTEQAAKAASKGLSDTEKAIRSLEKGVAGTINVYKALGGSATETTATLKASKQAALEMAKGLKQGSAEYVRLTAVAAKAQSGINAAASAAKNMAASSKKVTREVDPLQKRIASLQNEINGVRNAYVTTGGPAEKFANDMRLLAGQSMKLADGLAKDSKEFRQLTTAAAQAERAATSALGGMSRLGLASQVQRGTIGLGPRLAGVGGAAESALMMAPGGVGMTAWLARPLARDLGKLGPVMGTATAGLLAFGAAEAYGVVQAGALGKSQAYLEAITNQSKGAYDDLTVGIQRLSLQIPVAASGLYDVARAAAEVGVDGSKNILAFTGVVERLSILTGGDAEQIANNLAKFLNETGITSSMPGYLSELNKVGNALVAVHIKSAATADETLQLARYFSAVASVVGLSRPQIIALSGSLAALGGQAQSSGTNLAKFFLQMARGAANLTPQFKAMATIAGESVGDFRALVESNPVNAFIELAHGLSHAEGKGAEFTKAMDDIGAQNARLIRVLAQATIGGKSFLDILDAVNKSMQDQSMLTDTTKKAFDNLDDQFVLLGNHLSTLLADLGKSPASGLTDFLKTLNTELDKTIAAVLALDKVREDRKKAGKYSLDPGAAAWRGAGQGALIGGGLAATAGIVGGPLVAAVLAILGAGAGAVSGFAGGYSGAEVGPYFNSRKAFNEEYKRQLDILHNNPNREVFGPPENPNASTTKSQTLAETIAANNEANAKAFKALTDMQDALRAAGLGQLGMATGQFATSMSAQGLNPFTHLGTDVFNPAGLPTSQKGVEALTQLAQQLAANQKQQEIAKQTEKDLAAAMKGASDAEIKKAQQPYTSQVSSLQRSQLGIREQIQSLLPGRGFVFGSNKIPPAAFAASMQTDALIRNIIHDTRPASFAAQSQKITASLGAPMFAQMLQEAGIASASGGTFDRTAFQIQHIADAIRNIDELGKTSGASAKAIAAAETPLYKRLTALGVSAEDVDKSLKDLDNTVKSASLRSTLTGQAFSAVKGTSPVLSGAISAGKTGFTAGGNFDKSGAYLGGGAGALGAAGGAILSLVTSSKQFGQLMNIIDPLLQTVADAFGSLLEPLMPIAEILSTILSPVFKVIGTILKELLLPVFKALFPIIKDFGILIIGVAKLGAEIWNGFAAIVNALLGWLGVNLGKIDISGLDDAMNTLKDTTWDSAKAQADNADATKKATEAIRNLPDIIKITQVRMQAANADDPEAALAKAMGIPHFATGGRKRGDGLAYLHDDEIVLNKQQQAAAIGGSVTITGPIYVQDGRDFGKQLEAWMRRAGLRNYGNPAAAIGGVR